MRDLGLIHERKRRPKGLTKATTEAPVPNPHLQCDERRGQDDHIPVCIHLLQHCPDQYIQSRRTSSGSIPDDLATGRKELEDLVLELATKIRENMSIRKLEVIDVPAGSAAATYVHSDFKTGAVVVVEGSDAESVKVFAK